MSATERKKKWTAKIKEENVRLYLKFDIGDTCWFIYSNKIRKSVITSVILKLGIETKYITNSLTFKESEIFQTKQALINSLYIEFEKSEKVENGKWLRL